MLTKYNQNLHTHGILCDGKNEYEDTVKRAIALGFDSIGFSGHCYTQYPCASAMTKEGTERYKQEIRRLKEVYKDRIQIFCGIEFDMYSEEDLQEFDYVIGAVHYLKIGQEYVGFDRDAKTVEQVIQTYFGGDGMRYAKAYYETLSQLPQYAEKCDIVGHVDLITKHMETHPFFDTSSKEYQNLVFGAIDVLADSVGVFEVNTGAIARGYRTTPYPEPFILKELKKRGCGIVLSSDCHDNRFLNCYFEQALQLVKDCGFKEVLKLTEKGFEAYGI